MISVARPRHESWTSEAVTDLTGAETDAGGPARQPKKHHVESRNASQSRTAAVEPHVVEYTDPDLDSVYLDGDLVLLGMRESTASSSSSSPFVASPFEVSERPTANDMSRSQRMQAVGDTTHSRISSSSRSQASVSLSPANERCVDAATAKTSPGMMSVGDRKGALLGIEPYQIPRQASPVPSEDSSNGMGRDYSLADSCVPLLGPSAFQGSTPAVRTLDLRGDLVHQKGYRSSR